MAYAAVDKLSVPKAARYARTRRLVLLSRRRESHGERSVRAALGWAIGAVQRLRRHSTAPRWKPSLAHDLFGSGIEQVKQLRVLLSSIAARIETTGVDLANERPVHESVPEP